MIIVETPLRSITTLRNVYTALLAAQPDLERKAWLEGALALLDWLEHGGEPPVEML